MDVGRLAGSDLARADPPLKLAVQAQGEHYQGTVELKQKDFGIEPISVGGGAVKVKNELRVEFDIVAKP